MYNVDRKWETIVKYGYHFYRVITTHSRFKSRMCCYLYSLSKILFTYCMYIIINKATFRVTDAIKANIMNNTILSLSSFTCVTVKLLVIYFFTDIYIICDFLFTIQFGFEIYCDKLIYGVFWEYIKVSILSFQKNQFMELFWNKIQTFYLHSLYIALKGVNVN